MFLCIIPFRAHCTLYPIAAVHTYVGSEAFVHIIIATDEGLHYRNILYSLQMHSCALLQELFHERVCIPIANVVYINATSYLVFLKHLQPHTVPVPEEGQSKALMEEYPASYLAVVI